MSAKSDLSGLAVGDEFIAPIGFADQTRRATVEKIGRTWITDDRGARYRIADGESAQHTTMFRYAMTLEDYAQHVKDEANRAVLLRWRMLPTGGRYNLDSSQLAQVAALLAEFELPPVPAPEDPGKEVCVEVTIEPSWTIDMDTSYVMLTEGEIAARRPSQSREDRIIDLCAPHVNDRASWGATEIDELPPGAEAEF